MRMMVMQRFHHQSSSRRRRRRRNPQSTNSRIHTPGTTTPRSPTTRPLVLILLSKLPKSPPRPLVPRNRNAVASATAVAVAATITTARANGNGEALHSSRPGLLARIHAVVDAEIATDHVGACGGCVACQRFRRVVLPISTVFAIVDAHDARVAAARQARLKHGLRPVSAFAESCCKSIYMQEQKRGK
jgi:hypothetical protein